MQAFAGTGEAEKPVPKYAERKLKCEIRLRHETGWAAQRAVRCWLGIIAHTMKKIITIGFIAALLVLVTLLAWQHFKPSRDAKIRKNLTGTWVVDFGSFTVRPDGSYVGWITNSTSGVVTNEGTFQIRDDYLINTMTKTSRTNARVPYVGHLRIIRANDGEIVLDDGGVEDVLRKVTK